MDKVRIFISYARKDREFLDRLLTHLAPLESEGLIEPWTDREIEAGDRWDADIAAALSSAQIVLLLISADFLASKYIAARELAQALERERRKEAVVIPVILKFADWSTSPFHSLQALPPGAKPITDWRNRDEAWTEVAQGLRRVIGRFHAAQDDPAAGPGRLVIDPETVRQDRVLDAAMAARIPLGKPSDLAVMVRKTDSAGLKAILGTDDEFTAAPEDVKSKPFQLEFDRDSTGALKAEKLTVKIESPDFDPPSQSDDIIVPPDRDSDVCTFLLRPLFPGELVIKLKVFAQDGRNTIRLMRIFSEASDRVIEGGKIIATIPITTVAGSVQTLAAGPPMAAMPPIPPPAPMAAAPARMEAPQAPRGAVPHRKLDRIGAAPAPEPPKSRKRAWVLSSAGAAAATVLIGTAIYLVPGGPGSPVASVSDAIQYPAAPPIVPATGGEPSRSPASVAAAPPPPAPSGWKAEYHKGFEASKSGNLESAAKSFEEASRIAPSEPAPVTALATTNLKLADRQSSADRGKYLTAALDGAKQAADLQPDSAKAQYLQGLALEKTGSFAAAEEPLRQATKLNPEDATAWYALGFALAKQEKNADAVQALEEAVRLDPANSDARLLLASVLAQQKAPGAKKQIEVLANDSSLSPKKKTVVERMQKTVARTQ